MLRFIKEFFKRGLKCERLGHEHVNKKNVIRREGGGRVIRAVCTDYDCEIPTCKRCGHKLEPVNEVIKTAWDGVSMPSSYWDEMRENGYLVR